MEYAAFVRLQQPSLTFKIFKALVFSAVTQNKTFPPQSYSITKKERSFFMLKLSRTLPVLLVSALIFGLSCSEVAVTGRKQFNVVPDSLINTMSLQSYEEFISTNKLSSNAQQTAMVKQTGQKIAAAVEKYCQEHSIQLKDYAWEFNLVEDSAVNAWAMPGGKVVVYTGLLPVAKDDTGLAVVLGHEIAHAVAKHGSERMSQGLLVEMGGMALSEALTKQPAATQTLFSKSYGVGTQVGVLLPFSRKHELEADRMGLVFMAMAGYNPQAAVEFWQRMSADKSGAAYEILSTHPADKTRIAEIEKYLPEAMTYYQSASK